MATPGGRCGAAVIAALLVACAAGAAATGLPGAGQDAGQDAGAAPPPFLGGFLEETRIVYPLRVGGWDAVGEQLFDIAELGASVRYRRADNLDRWIDVYFYPVGVVPDSHLDQAAQATLREIGSGVGVPGGYAAADFGALHAFKATTDGGIRGEPLAARSADMRLLRDGVAYHSAMTLLIDRMYYVKGRHSVAAAEMRRGEVRSELERFIADLVAATYIGSTGGCWSPARIEAPPADAANRHHPGCVGAGSHNPDVPEGHREIRLEYRAPAAAPNDRARRLAPSRDGMG